MGGRLLPGRSTHLGRGSSGLEKRAPTPEQNGMEFGTFKNHTSRANEVWRTRIWLAAARGCRGRRSSTARKTPDRTGGCRKRRRREGGRAPGPGAPGRRGGK